MISMFHSLGITDISQLVIATLIFLILPGPGTFCILTGAARNGLRGGFSALAGLMLGDALLMFFAAIGVAALLQANSFLFLIVQYLGAAYLVFLGWKLLVDKKEADSVIPFSNLADFRRGFLVTIMNPKAIVFYMAFFPLFIDPMMHRGSLTFFTMGTVISTCTLFYGCLLVLIGNSAAKFFANNRRMATFASKAAGIFLIGFGIKLTTN